MNDNIYGEKIPEDWKSSTTIPIIPEDWKSSTTITIYKGKGNAMECGKYRGVIY